MRFTFDLSVLDVPSKLKIIRPSPNLPQGGGVTGVRTQDHRHFRVDSPSANLTASQFPRETVMDGRRLVSQGGRSLYCFTVSMAMFSIWYFYFKFLAFWMK